MIQVHPHLYLGSQHDAEANPDHPCIVHACKEPYHRRALGYTGRAAPNTHPEYLFAERSVPGGARLILNLVDVPDPKYIHPAIVDKAVDFIAKRLEPSWLRDGESPTPVLVHCNEGRSRCSLIGMAYLASIGMLQESFEAAEEAFRKLYPPYQPAAGVRGFLMANWSRLRGGS